MTASAAASVSVIIVNFNGGDFIQTTIDYLAGQTSAPDEVIVVDNASTDGSADRLDLSALANARLIRSQENLGFAGANNLAAREAKGDWLALLNPDTEAQPDWLQALKEAAARYPGTTSFASAQIDAVNPGILDGAGDCYAAFGFPWRGGFGNPARLLPEEGECFSPCGASAFIRRDVFLGAGGFDETYFCYCEDVDLGYRLRLCGERCIFVPSAAIRHHGSATTGRYSDFTVTLGTRNRLTTYVKNTPLLLLLLTMPAHLAMTLLLYLLALGKPKAGSIRRGFVAGLARLPQTLRARRRVQSDKKCSSLEIARAMSWNPIRMGRRRSHVWRARPEGQTKGPA